MKTVRSGVAALFSLALVSMSAWGADNDLAAKIPGLWLVTWTHGTVTMTDAQGKTTQQERFTPGSYGAAQEAQPEYFYLFRADGTGTYLDRWIRKPIGTAQPVVVLAQDKSNAWVEKDVLSRRINFTWKLDGAQLSIAVTTVPAPLYMKSGIHKIEWSANPTRRSNTAQTADGYRLSDELIIYNAGAMVRVDPAGAQKLLDHYGIKG
jgi:hypothetical protein